MSWRWLGLSDDAAQANMDRDRELFEEVKRGEGVPFLRFYRWTHPALSYGRTQGIDEASCLDALSKGWEVVRRPTGGGKVYHGSDVCFSLSWRKADSALPWTINESYRVIHSWIQESLRGLGIHSELTGRKADAGNGWCFQSAVCSDLLLNGRKIVGGAQWRDGSAALHQGSIQLRLTPGQISRFRDSFTSFFGAQFGPSAAPSFRPALPRSAAACSLG